MPIEGLGGLHNLNGVVSAHMGVSENEGTLFWGPYIKDPTI